LKIVFSVGGSLVVPEEVDPEFVRKFCSLVRELSSDHRIAVVVGGGRLARKYINAAGSFEVSDEVKDLLGIEATHLNAMLFAAALGDKAVYRRVVSAADLGGRQVVVTGGTTPGHSTDAVAAELAVKSEADLLVNVSNITGVYDSDPSANPNARLLKRVSADKLLELVSSLPQTPGKYALMDRLSVDTIRERGLKTLILGSDILNIRNAVLGKDFVGTTVG